MNQKALYISRQNTLPIAGDRFPAAGSHIGPFSCYHFLFAAIKVKFSLPLKIVPDLYSAWFLNEAPKTLRPEVKDIVIAN